MDLLFDQKVADFILWFTSRGRESEVLQKLADEPPNGSRGLPIFIFVATLGAVKPTVSAQTGINPVNPYDDWFVLQRPFANRQKLRDDLRAFDKAPAGADSVLVIEGDRFSGKSYSVQFAIQCAPQERYVPIDIAEWGETPMNAEDLAKAIGGYTQGADFPSFDITKEDEAVPRLLQWLIQRLKGTKTWVIVDHCNRPALTRAASTLLARFAGSIEKGFLSNVKLIVADIDRTKLPGVLPHRSRHDRAVLPNEEAVGKWCESLAAHLNKTLTEEQLSKFINEAFDGISMLNGAASNQLASTSSAAQPATQLQVEDEVPIDQAARILEDRLLKISSDILAL
jgi:hypothetical protein